MEPVGFTFNFPIYVTYVWSSFGYQIKNINRFKSSLMNHINEPFHNWFLIHSLFGCDQIICQKLVRMERWFIETGAHRRIDSARVVLVAVFGCWWQNWDLSIFFMLVPDTSAKKRGMLVTKTIKFVTINSNLVFIEFNWIEKVPLW